MRGIDEGTVVEVTVVNPLQSQVREQFTAYIKAVPLYSRGPHLKP
jgi:hypothetical protein